MNFFLVAIFLFFLNSCSKPETVLICGNHICINKTEAEQYFEENLSIEVKIINKKENKKIDLIELNLKENQVGNRQISLLSKKNTNENIKILSKKEILQIKDNIKSKKKKKRLVRKTKQNVNKKRNNNKVIKNIKDINRNKSNVVDICTILKECNIDEISKYLLKQGKMKKFPDITKRQ